MSKKTKGIILIIISAMAFSIMQIFIAKTKGKIPLFEQVFFRNALSAIVAYIALRKKGYKAFGEKSNRSLLCLRSLTGYLGMITLFYAVANGNQGDVTILTKMSPFVVTILATVFLKERINIWHSISLILAFSGAAIMANPRLESNLLPLLIAFASAVFSGIAYTIVGALKEKEKPEVIVFFFSIFSTLATTGFMLFNFVIPSPQDFLLLIGISIMATIGQLTLTYSYILANASEVSVFNYSGIVFSMLFGYFFLSQSIKPSSILSAALIILAGIIAFINSKKSSNLH